MSDDDIRALFRRVDDGPPLGIDVRDVMADGRRVRARRTGLAVAGSVVGAVTAVAVAIGLFTAGGDPRSPDVIRPADPVTTSPTSEPGTSPHPQVPPPSGVPMPGGTPPAPEQGSDPPAPEAGTPSGAPG